MENKNPEMIQQSENPTSVNPVSQISTPSLSSKTNWMFLAIVAVLGLFVGGVMLMYGSILSRPLPQPVQVLRPKIPKPTPKEIQPQEKGQTGTKAPSSELTAGWQTYRNSKFGFEIKYPKEFEVNVAGVTKDSPDRLNFQPMDINCKNGWVPGWEGDYSYVLERGYGKYPRSKMVIDDHEVIVHFIHFLSPVGYSYEYEIKKDNCTLLIFTFGSRDVSQPTAEQKGLFDQILATLRFIEGDEAALWTDCVDDPKAGVPVITSVSPGSGPVGTELEIRGCNFSGFEGDLNAWIENSQGISATLYGKEGSTSKLLEITLGSPLCQVDNSYSGIPCGRWLTLTPGVYEIYVEPWGKKSNEVSFTIK